MYVASVGWVEAKRKPTIPPNGTADFSYERMST